MQSIQLCVYVYIYIYIFQYTHLMSDTSNIPSVSKEVVFFAPFSWRLQQTNICTLPCILFSTTGPPCSSICLVLNSEVFSEISFACFDAPDKKLPLILAVTACAGIPGMNCRSCGLPAGTFSSKIADVDGITFICEPCPAGSMQASGASVECVPCKAGEYQDVNGSISCKRCGLDEYQDQTGALSLNS